MEDKVDRLKSSHAPGAGYRGHVGIYDIQGGQDKLPLMGCGWVLAIRAMYLYSVPSQKLVWDYE